MKPYWANNNVYEFYDNFLKESILGNDSYLTDDKNEFTLENINACVSSFVDKPDTSSRSFDEKASDQFKDANSGMKLVFSHCIWLWSHAAGDMTQWGKKNAVVRFLGDEKSSSLKDVFIKGGIGSAGQWHKQNKPFEISYALLLLKYIKQHLVPECNNDIQKLKELIVKLCLDLYYQRYEELKPESEKLQKVVSERQLALHHILLHLSDFDAFEPITSNNHKSRIVSTFYTLLGISKPDELWSDIDGSILKIRTALSDIMNRKDLTFYDQDIARAWNYHDSEWGIDSVELFEYKKALILYGPPGTSKTHSAYQLSEMLISKHYFRNKEKVKEYFSNKDEIISSHTHFLQLHTNFSYEDFIAGIHLDDHKTVAKKGWLLNLIEKVKDDELPHIVILDEINRVDLSRLFGELFSGIEYRDKPVQITVGNSDFEINVPSNLYFIGTMNEIDFSLERVDFALRRRFLWEFKGFDSDILREILNQKNSGVQVESEVLEGYISRCSNLNEKISNEPELGKKYQIGHTFFGEVLDIASTFKTIHGSRKDSFKKLSGPSKILWGISIQPMLEAYFGNMDEQTRIEKLAEFEKVFMND